MKHSVECYMNCDFAYMCLFYPFSVKFIWFLCGSVELISLCCSLYRKLLLWFNHTTTKELLVALVVKEKMSMMWCGFGWRKANHMNAQSVLNISWYVTYCWHKVLAFREQFLAWIYHIPCDVCSLTFFFELQASIFISTAWCDWRRIPWWTWWWRWSPPLRFCRLWQ